MVNVLIYTVRDDSHAQAVKWALDKKNIDNSIWYTDKFPDKSEGSIAINQDTGTEFTWHGSKDLTLSGFSAIWNRRITQPTVRADVHEADRHFAEREALEFAQSAYLMKKGPVFEVNPGEARRIAMLKPVQLSEAVKAGLRIPDTLISNSPERVASFYKKHQGHIIFKSFTPHAWRTDLVEVANLTSAVDQQHIDDSESIAVTPGIYQAKIDKAHEYRITFMGRRSFIAVNHSFNPSIIDGRTTSSAADGTHLVSEALLRKCWRLLDQLGICFGCFDFAQAKDGGEPIFLEVNEMGQWLSYEGIIPAFPMLDTFCEFITSLDPHFDDKTPAAPLKFSDYLSSREFRHNKTEISRRTREQNVLDNTVTYEHRE